MKFSSITRRAGGLLLGLGLALEVAAQSSGTAYARPLVNQAGYNLQEGKRFVLPYAPEGLAFQVVKAADSLTVDPKPLFVGRVQGQAGDFTAFNPRRTGEQYVIRLAGYACRRFAASPPGHHSR